MRVRRQRPMSMSSRCFSFAMRCQGIVCEREYTMLENNIFLLYVRDCGIIIFQVIKYCPELILNNCFLTVSYDETHQFSPAWNMFYCSEIYIHMYVYVYCLCMNAAPMLIYDSISANCLRV